MNWPMAMALSVVLLTSSPATTSDPAKVVSLDLCSDWLLQTYASPDQIAGLSALSATAILPGYERMNFHHHDSSLESIIELDPDLVIVGEYNAWLARERLSALGYRVEILALPQTLNDLVDQVGFINTLLGNEATELLLPDRLPQTGERILKLGANGIATGQATFENALLEYAGWSNYVTSYGYVGVDMESIIIDPPNRLLVSAPGTPALANRVSEHPVWKKMLAEDQIKTTDDWRWQCPGPWTSDLIRELREWH